MRILLVGPHPFLGGGVAAHEQAIAKQLTMHGNKVGILGLEHRPQLASSTMESIESPEFEHLGIDLFLLAHGKVPFFGVFNPLEQCGYQIGERLFGELLETWKPDIVHFLAARPASLIAAAAERDVPVVVTLHDYWYLCSKGFLVRKDGVLCDGPEGGDACVRYCLDDNRGMDKSVTQYVKGSLRKSVPGEVYRSLKRLYLQIKAALHHRSALDELLTSESRPRDYKQGEVDAWRFRTNYMRDLLSTKADVIIAVSRFVEEKVVEFGVPSEKVRLMHAGFEHSSGLFDHVKHRSPLQPPITFGYISPIFREKGLHVLVKAFEILPAGSARLVIYGRMSEWSAGYWQPLLNICRTLPNVVVKGEFNYSELPTIFEQIDVLVVPAIMHDPGPRVVWEALAAKVPPICSRVGGIPDFVHDRVNGLLFERENADDLAQKMKALIMEPRLIEDLRQGIRPLKSMEEQATEWDDLHKELVQSARRWPKMSTR